MYHNELATKRKEKKKRDGWTDNSIFKEPTLCFCSPGCVGIKEKTEEIDWQTKQPSLLMFVSQNCTIKIHKWLKRMLHLTPALPQHVKFPGLKVQAYTPSNSVFDGPITNPVSVLCILIEILSHAHGKAKEKKKLNDFKSGTFIGQFLSEQAWQ